jgi:hypothetical protein
MKNLEKSTNDTVVKFKQKVLSQYKGKKPLLFIKLHEQKLIEGTQYEISYEGTTHVEMISEEQQMGDVKVQDSPLESEFQIYPDLRIYKNGKEVPFQSSDYGKVLAAPGLRVKAINNSQEVVALEIQLAKRAHK